MSSHGRTVLSLVCLLIAFQVFQFSLREFLCSSVSSMDPSLLLQVLDTSTISLHSARNGSLPEAKEPQETESFRFPTIDERIEYYMGDWFDTNRTNFTGFCRHLPPLRNPSSNFPSDRDLLFTLSSLQQRHLMPKFWTAFYLREVANVLTHVESTSDQSPDPERYVLLRLGDSATHSDVLPVVAKTRSLEGHKTIIFPMGLSRHFVGTERDLQAVVDRGDDTAWPDKRPALVWRGSCTGLIDGSSSRVPIRLVFTERFHAHNESETGINIAMKDKCHRTPKEWKHKIQPDWFRKPMAMAEFLQYKYLLSLEGNDVATNLKWLLASSSVVFMPHPTAASWLMEDRLVPYVHYIPVAADGSDLETQLAWARVNDDKCQWISAQATQYMRLVWNSPEAKRENTLIRMEMGDLYNRQFGEPIGQCLASQK